MPSFRLSRFTALEKKTWLAGEDQPHPCRPQVSPPAFCSEIFIFPDSVLKRLEYRDRWLSLMKEKRQPDRWHPLRKEA